MAQRVFRKRCYCTDTFSAVWLSTSVVFVLISVTSRTRNPEANASQFEHLLEKSRAADRKHVRGQEDASAQ